MSLGNNISTNGGNLDINTPVTLTGDITIATSNGTVDFSSSINGAQSLTINSGTGAIALQGIIGDTTALSALSINATDGAANAGTIEIFDIGDDSPATGVTGAVSIGNANTASLTLDGTNYDTTGVTVYEAAAGSNSILLTGACLLYTSDAADE